MPDYPFNPEYLIENKRALKKRLRAKEGLVPKRVALLSGATIGSIRDLLELFLLDEGIAPEFFEGGYGRFYEDVVFDDGALAEFAPDVIYIHTSVRALTLPRAGAGAEEAERLLDEAYGRYEAAWRAAARKFRCAVIQDNFEYPRVRVMGSYEAVSPSGKVRFVRRLNERMARYAEANAGFYVNDLNWLAAYHGLKEFCDTTAYNAYKYSVAPAMTPYLCHSVASIIKSLFGKNKKALMLDLDNTLWGGVVGDDGVEGIRLGAESPEGMAYLDMQRYASELPALGVLLGVCSKNDDATAREGFEHPSSLLKPEDFASFRASWDDKDRSLAAAARALNIGADYLVLADDNPAEREIVKASGLGVATPELIVPELFAETVANAGYFEVTSLSDDDKARAAMYRANAERAASETTFADYGDYLRSLEMTAYLCEFGEGASERLTQLANKTNQFNLTTRRYAPNELLALSRDGAHISIAARLADKFGDNGLVSELLARIEGETADVELWLMSCRVFKRDLELAVFDELVAQCRARGITEITGAYLPTGKNAIVADLYASLGFERAGETDGGSLWKFIIPDDYQNKNTAVEVRHDESRDT